MMAVAGRARIVLLVLLALWLGCQAALAIDSAAIGQAERSAASHRAQLERIKSEFSNASLNAEQLAADRSKLEDIRTAAQIAAASLAAPLAELELQIGKLGPPPPERAGEAPAIVAQRKALDQDLQRLEGASKQLELIAVEAEQLIGRAAAIQRDRFFSQIFESGRSILNPLLWYEGGIEATVLIQRVGALVANWWREVGSTASLARLLLIPFIFAAAFAAYWAGRRWLAAKLKLAPASAASPDDLSRLWRVVRSVMATVFFILGLAVSAYLAANAAGLVTPRIALLFNAATTFMLNAVPVAVLAARLAAPGQTAWRLVDLDENTSARFVFLVSLAAIMAAAEQALRGLAEALFVSVGFSVGQSALSAAILLCTIALMLITVQDQAGAGVGPRQRFYFRWAGRAVPLIWLSLATAALALLLGYVALGNFIARQLYETSVLLVALALLHHLLDAAIAASFDPHSRIGKALRALTGLGERGIDRLGLMLRTLIDLILVLVGLPLLLLVWTITWIDVRSWLNTAIVGFRLGDVTISPSTVLLALAILVLGIVATRLFARWLDNRILSETRLDKGVQDSIRKGAVYAGYILASGIALTAAGLEFSNLAIIAGALGVGIGFGLQSIVNNFVSGLILLAERPVRVGDWIQLGVGEGLVKKINVRSTEIETFDNCAIIVPNSNLITEPVKNWTHGDSMGRFLVQVSVSYGSEPEAVRDLLLRLAREHPLVLTYPEPQVVLAALTPQGLSFELRAFVADIFTGGGAASDLRFAILKALRDNGIELSVPVQEVRIRPRP